MILLLPTVMTPEGGNIDFFFFLFFPSIEQKYRKRIKSRENTSRSVRDRYGILLESGLFIYFSPAAARHFVHPVERLIRKR